MYCKNCGYPQSSVIHTYIRHIKNIIERRRECQKCGSRFTTYEKLKEPKIKATVNRQEQVIHK